MTKVLLLSHIFPPAVDGGSRVIYKLGQQFEAKGYDTLYLSSDCFSTDDFTKKRLTITKELGHQRTKAPENKKIIKIPIYACFRQPLKLLEIVCTNLLFINPKSYFINLIKVFQKGPIFKFFPFVKATIKIIKFKPDLIVAGPLPTTIVLYARFIKFLSRVLAHQRTKLLINSSFHPTDQDFHQLPLIRSLQQADYLWTLTNFESDYFVKKLKINQKKIILAGNGVDPDFLISKYQNNKKSRVLEHQSTNILFIGSLSAHKRVDLLINSFSSLFTKVPEHQNSLSLTVAGQKTLFYPQIEKTFKSLPLEVRKKVKFVFDFPQDKLAKLIDNCTILVLPSTQESFGLVLIEAWARGKPVIVSNIPSLSEIVSLSNGGLIFKKDNQADLIKKIKQLIDSPETCYRYGQNGLRYVKTNYTWEKVSQKISQKIRLF